ncbi:PAN domain-containing protein [Roseibium polysiphoniae]|uniref:PAN domain-containing protein n=1 Tax=Roseibium polysiphoniae TaxID=2571221 RepID=UPI0032994C5B
MTSFYSAESLKLHSNLYFILVAVLLAVTFLATPAFSQTSLSSSSSKPPAGSDDMDVFLQDLDTSLGKPVETDLDTETPPSLEEDGASGNELGNSSFGLPIALDSKGADEKENDRSAITIPSTEQESGSSSSTAKSDSPAKPMSMDSGSKSKATATSASPGSLANKYKMFVSFDLPKGDMFSAKDLNINQCIKLCDKDKACSAVTYDRWNRYCFAKNVSRSTRRLFVQAKSDTYILENETLNVSASSSKIEIQRRRGKGFNGTPDYTASNASYNKCTNVCRADKKCVAFNHISSKQLCEFFSKPPEYFSKNGYQIGVKQQLQ